MADTDRIFDHSAEHHAEQLALVLAVTRAPNKAVSQPERVLRLQETRNPRAVLRSLLEASGAQLPLTGPEDPTAAGTPLIDAAHQDIDQWTRSGATILSILDTRYPQTLAEVREAPALLYLEGELQENETGICVVGTRHLDAAGEAVARTVTGALVEHHCTIVSGLAAGTDTIAHQEALARGGRTVAVMGTGLDITSPASNRELRQRIVDSGGLILSQFPPGVRGSRATFPMRNAVMSGYGLATVVIAAGEHSGTRIQARKALDHGRGLILTDRVVRETTWGAQYAQRPGVTVARRSQDILDAVDRVTEDRRVLLGAW